MKIIAMADTHNQHNRINVPDGDIVIHAGDMTETGTRTEIKNFLQWYAALPHKHKVLVAGNHDFGFEEDEYTYAALCQKLGIVYLRDESRIVNGIKIHGSPWQPVFFNWAFNLPRGKQLAYKWDLIDNDVDILVTHGPPAGYGDLTARMERVGDEDLLIAIQKKKPKYHLFGHIHEDSGTWNTEHTVFMNVTTAYCKYKCTVIDTNFSP